MKQKILVTGAGGYIGAIATYLLLQQDYQVVAIDNFSTGFSQPLQLLQEKFGQERLRYYQLDLRDNLESFFRQETEIAAVMHYAAACKVDESIHRPEFYFSNNSVGSQNLLVNLLKYGIKKIIFSSTCAVYGEAEYIPVDENHPTRPKNPYGESKKITETILQWYGELKGLRYVVLRYFNVCGASDDGMIGDSKKPSVLLVQNAVRGALGIEPFFLTCPQVNTSDGTPIRDYINVVDLNEAHIKALEYLFNSGQSEVINLGTGKGNSVKEIITAVEKITGKQIKLQKADSIRQGEYAKMIASINKAKKILQWQPQRSIEDSVYSLIKWYNRHPYGW